MKTVRERRAEQGLCCYCGERPPKENRKKCRECLDKLNEKDNEKRKRHKALGLCQICHNPIDRENTRNGMTAALCSICTQDRRDYHVERRLIRVEKLQCWSCNNYLDTDGVFCSSCAEKNNAKNRAYLAYRKDNGLCLDCGKPTISKEKTCRKCLDKRYKAKRRKYNYDYLS